MPLHERNVQELLGRGGTILGTVNRGSPFAHPIERPDGTIEYEDVSHEALERMTRLGLDALIVAGGDGTMSIAHKLVEMGAHIVGVPKTIDNDLAQTDLTFGFDTAINTATEALDKLQTTAESHHRIMVLEVMGRDAGWIALHAGVAGGADAILIPEIPYDPDKVAKTIKDRESKGARFSIVVCAEGAHPINAGHSILEAAHAGHAERLGGA